MREAPLTRLQRLDPLGGYCKTHQAMRERRRDHGCSVSTRLEGTVRRNRRKPRRKVKVVSGAIVRMGQHRWHQCCHLGRGKELRGAHLQVLPVTGKKGDKPKRQMDRKYNLIRKDVR